MTTLYFDHAASTPCDPRVRDVLMNALEHTNANPHSTTYEAGRAATHMVERARAHVATLIGADPREIIFTSGATESNNLAIKGAVRHLARIGSTRRRVITIATEHKCVLQSVLDLKTEGFEPVILPVEPDGRLASETLTRALETPTALVSIAAANHETGVLQDLNLLGTLIKESGALFHSDLAQAAGKIPINVHDLKLSLASLSSHKLYGPKGVGALFIRRNPRVRLQPLFSGGGQERGLRSGTLPGFLLAGFGQACHIAQQEHQHDFQHLTQLQSIFLHTLESKLPGCCVNAALTPRLPGIISLRLPEGIKAIDVIAHLPTLEISLGSACSSALLEPSYVLRAIGLSISEAERSLRLSPGRFTTQIEAENAAHELAHTALHVRPIS